MSLPFLHGLNVMIGLLAVMTSSIAIIGAGPAGLMAADILSAAGLQVDLYDRMPTVARKFLMAGRGGLNLSHSEAFERFVSRYGKTSVHLRPALEAFTSKDLRDWADGLGAESFVGSSGRIFPKAMKASPLLRNWLRRLEAQGVRLHTRHDWRGFDDGDLLFAHGADEVRIRPDITLLALGGASWPKLGADGGWVPYLREKNVDIAPFIPANVGFQTAWSQGFADKFAGQPLKNIAVSFAGRTVKGEMMLTRDGLEGGAIYAISSVLRDVIIRTGYADLAIDLRPDLNSGQVISKFGRASPKDSLSNRLRKSLNLSPAAIGLVHEVKAADIKTVTVRLTGVQTLERAISSAGGISFSAVNADYEIIAIPGVYAVGEMLDWEAPTGGYLLQACFSTAVMAAKAIIRR